MSKIPLSVFLEAMREERDNLARRVEAIDMLLSTYEETDHKDAVKPKKEKPRTQNGAKVRHCKACGKAGHRRDNCPNGDGTPPSDDEVDEVVKRPEVTREQVQELKDKGLNSIQIAAKLRTTLSQVNKH